MGFAAISPVVGLYAVVLVGTISGGSGVGVGAAGRARRPVPAARGVRRARIRVPDRGRRVPVEPAPDRRGLRLVHRLGRDLRVRGGEHDDRLPRRPVGADARRDRAVTPQPDRGHRDGARRGLLRARRLVRRRRARPRVVKVGIGAEIVASVGDRRSSCCSPSARRTSRPSTHTLGAEALSGRVGRARGCSPHWPSAAGCSSASTPASGASEETRERRVARPAGDLDRAAERRRARDPQRRRGRRSPTRTRPAVVAGEDLDPVTTAVVTSFGSWSAKPFAAVVLVAFLACGMAAQALTARTIYSIARDGVLPGVGLPAHASTVAASPVGAIVATTAVGVPRPAARPQLGRGRQPDRVRHRGDLRRVPARRARGADRPRRAARGGLRAGSGSVASAR